MRFSLLSILLMINLLLPKALLAQQAGPAEIQALLDKQSTAWNKGDLEGYMQFYWHSDSLLFIGKNGPRHGWQTTLDAYKKGYPTRANMGQLDFTLLEWRQPAPDAWFVVGKWHLKRVIGDLQGYFTLLLRKIDGVWKIVADHSSSS
ncbi:Ketosteroid isomerase homolog [Chitinophaga costaii]|uniref:Ketosteroid isomerase homolog n=1 Tax=Chitinophaga costaii TaxID=1335309 RepID=A0A1C4AEC6_9BACT|nr:DUF4440 domain-containing protein [Chitinophaga costaii]PUZ26871.1 DUF4440 domain-containing protein [Chitinophaga costaii]SCB92933.1 Ketosteroid isomerase homolog [Chitinophaga costaii]